MLFIFVYSVISLFFILGTLFSLVLSPHSFLWIFAATINLTIGAFTYQKNPKETLNRSFAFASICIGLWCLNSYALFIAQDPASAKALGILLSIGMLFTPPAVLIFAFVLTGYDAKVRRKYTIPALIVSGIFTIFSYSASMTGEFIKVGWKYSPQMKSPYLYFMVYSAVCLLISIFIVINKYISTNSIKTRNQLKLMFIGMGIGCGFALTNYIASFGIKFYPIGALGPIVYTMFVAYAILKYQLMDIQVIIRRSLIYAVLTLSVVVVYSILVGLSTGVLARIGIEGSGDWLIHAFAGALSAVLFLSVKDRIQNIIDRVFFKEKYDNRSILTGFSQEISSIRSIQGLIVMLVQRITDILHIDKGFLMLYDEEHAIFRTMHVRGYSSVEAVRVNGFMIPQDDPLLAKVRHGKLLIDGQTVREGVSSELRSHGIVLLLPLLTKGKLLGILCLGNKLSEDLYTNEDIELLGIVDNQAAIAIESIDMSVKMMSLEKELYRADKLSALGTLSSSIAHEIKNPLASIKAFCQLMGRRSSETEFLNSFNKIVPHEIERMEHILNQMLGFGKPETIERGPVKIHEKIDDVVEIMSYQIFKQNVTIQRDYADEVMIVSASSGELQQVFMNIVLNAIQAMPNGGTINIKTEVNAEDQAVLYFSDTGTGIKEEDKSRIFKKMFTTKADGTGLGLSIIQKIIHGLSGDIKVESMLSVGTTFQIFLPLVTKQQ